MGIFDALMGTDLKNRITELEFENEHFKSEYQWLKKQNDKANDEMKKLRHLNSSMQQEIQKLKTPEMQNIDKLNAMRDEINRSIADINATKTGLEQEIQNLNGTISTLNNQITAKRKQLIETDEEILLQEFGLYTPKYEFAKADEYKAKLVKIRQQQKELIKNGRASTGGSWTVNGNAAQGKKMVNDMQKLLLRAFNCECDEVIAKVKFNSFDSASKRITSSYEAISKLGSVMGVSITKEYYDLKIDELYLSLDYQQKKQEEKERQKELRAQEREMAKVQKEIELERKKQEKERQHYENAQKTLQKQLYTASPEAKEELRNKLEEIQSKLDVIDRAIQDIDYRAANQKAGYVYIISNIGSFGENVYKIGMTRRLDPMDRIVELGDASVPFNFDVHAMIFSDDAPALEAALHRAFDSKKVNMVNQRREFFNVTLDEIKQVVRKNFDKTVEFNDFPDAEQYRVSLKLKESKA